MGTRGFLGIRNNKKLLEGYYNHYDSYYDNLGKEVIDFYFDGKGNRITELTKNNEDDKDFLQDGLFCEYAYVYNQDNDTLEIYRGFFKTKQSFNTKERIINSLDEDNSDTFYCHLIMIIDRKKHTKEQVLKTFEVFDKTEENGDGGNSTYTYPEHKIIPLELPKNYIQLIKEGYKSK